MSKINGLRNNIYRQKVHENRPGSVSLSHDGQAFKSLQELKRVPKSKGIFDRKKKVKETLRARPDSQPNLTKNSVLNLNHLDDFFEEHE